MYRCPAHWCRCSAHTTEAEGADGKPLNIVKKIAAHDYTTFGMYLLQDENGEEVDLIEKDHISKGAESVTKEILKKWLTSDAPTRTYQHLIECLRQSELGALAEQLRITTCSCTRYAVVNIIATVLHMYETPAASLLITVDGRQAGHACT